MSGWSPPEEFDGYRLLRLIGRGGMGSVYLAHDTLLDRQVAVKFISASDANLVARKRFLLEAKAIARLSHPNVVSVYRVGHIADVPYLVSEFVRGTALDQLPTPLPWRQVLQVGLGIARGLAAAHGRGVVHRDIKPANVILSEDGEPKLLDFGIAKLIDASQPGPPRPPPGPSSIPMRDAEAPTAALAWSEAPVRSTRSDMSDELYALPADEPTADLPPLSDSQAADLRLSHAGLGDAVSGAPASRTQDETAELDAPRSTVSDPGIAPAVHDMVEPTCEDESDPRALSSNELPSLHALAASLSLAHHDLELTSPGAVVGTPVYMAPEVWRGEPATFQSDVYSFGALLYKLCTGRPVHVGSLNELRVRVQEEDAPALSELVPDIDATFAAIVQRCLARDQGERFAHGNDVRAALAQLTPEGRAAIVPEGNPYRGLYTFEVEHRSLYFGRDSEIRAVLDRLKAHGAALVVGDSGVGKSSLCRAGVLPRLSEWFGDDRTWSTVTLVPGTHPVQALALALSEHLQLEAGDLERLLVEDTPAFVREVSRAAGSGAGTLFFFDQLEELVTLTDPRDIQPLADLVTFLARGTAGVRFLGTVRGDYVSKLMALFPAADALSRVLYFLRPLTRERMREAIVGPARAKGVSFESNELVEQLVASTARTEGGLPLLQFALAELWEAREPVSQLISAASLEALGGVEGALTRHADDVLARMTPEARVAARRVLLQLVTSDGTRARRTEAELIDDEHARAALNALVIGRLVVARDTPDGSGYDIAHEALIHGWTTFAEWRSRDVDRRRVRERLVRAVDDWERLHNSRELLWSARQLAELEDREGLSPRELAFVETSRRAVRKARWRRGALLVGIPLVLLATYAVVTFRTRLELAQRVDRELRAASHVLHVARDELEELRKLEEQAFSLFDRVERDAGEAAWAKASRASGKAEARFADASRRLETALLLDVSRQDVRKAFADVLLERALLAEQKQRADDVAELLQRLALYDTDGAHMRRWNAPGELVLGSTPPAHILLERHVREGRELARVGEFAGRIETLTVERGSYLATFTVKGHATVRLPFSVGRGERVELTADLPRESSVPEGFVYVPAGPFWVGSADSDAQRRGFFHTVPLHRARTDGYLIAVHETTFADWLEYVRALPPDSRFGALPRVERGGFQGALALESKADGTWELQFQPVSQEFRVRTGQPLVYPTRTRATTHDWLALPVVGISSADAERYVAWLAASGRVPHARLCSELEWERAARGGDTRAYPHGDELAPEDANYDESYAKDPRAMGPDEVGSHPRSQSPFGIHDLAGNVWEWTRSSLSRDGHAARGGSFYFDINSSRTYNRETPEPSFRDVSVGLRVCADLPPG